MSIGSPLARASAVVMPPGLVTMIVDICISSSILSANGRITVFFLKLCLRFSSHLNNLLLVPQAIIVCNGSPDLSSRVMSSFMGPKPCVPPMIKAVERPCFKDKALNISSLLGLFRNFASIGIPYGITLSGSTPLSISFLPVSIDGTIYLSTLSNIQYECGA